MLPCVIDAGVENASFCDGFDVVVIIVVAVIIVTSMRIFFLDRVLKGLHLLSRYPPNPLGNLPIPAMDAGSTTQGRSHDSYVRQTDIAAVRRR